MSMKMVRSAIFKITMLMLVVSLTGCFGSFNLTKNVYNANDGVSDNGFVKSGVMVGMFIIPIYEVAAIADLLVFNVIEFWTGENPVAMNEGDMQRQLIHANGKDYQMDATKDRLQVTDLDDANAEVLSLHYNRTLGVWNVMK